MSTQFCDDCNNTGILVGMSAKGHHKCPKGFVCLQRCDACEKYKSDLAAARAHGTHARERRYDAVCKPHKK